MTDVPMRRIVNPTARHGDTASLLRATGTMLANVPDDDHGADRAGG